MSIDSPPSAPPPIAEVLSWYPIGFVVAFALALYFTPVLRNAARNYGIVDRPDGRLKNHREPVAYLGGLAVYIAFLLSLALIPSRFDERTLGLLLGGTIILLLGLMDDLHALTPGVKLLGQLLASFVLIKAGIRIEMPFLPEYARVTLTVLWVVTITNAFNIIDVMDGLCSGVGVICFAGLFAVAVLNGIAATDAELAARAASVALFIACFGGALVGFLKFNFRPAQIYLGDAGSMLIGFVAGSIAMTLSYTDHDPLGYTAPLFILGVPLFDLCLVILLRLRQGRSPFRGSPDHFAVRLRRHGISTGRIAALAYSVNALLATFGVTLIVMDPEPARIAIAIVAVLLLVAGVGVSRVGISRVGASSEPS